MSDMITWGTFPWDNQSIASIPFLLASTSKSLLSTEMSIVRIATSSSTTRTLPFFAAGDFLLIVEKNELY